MIQRYKRYASMIQRFWEGYEDKSWSPYTDSRALRVLRGLHHALGRHYPSRDGSWCFGYDYICGGCGMNVGLWSPEKCQSTGDWINKLPEAQRQSAMASVAGGRSHR